MVLSFSESRAISTAAGVRRCFVLTKRPIERILALALSKKKRASAEVVCPFCGQAEELYVDLGGGEHQTYTEDCAVCCRPRVVHVAPGDFAGEVSVWLEREE